MLYVPVYAVVFVSIEHLSLGGKLSHLDVCAEKVASQLGLVEDIVHEGELFFDCLGQLSIG